MTSDIRVSKNVPGRRRVLSKSQKLGQGLAYNWKNYPVSGPARPPSTTTSKTLEFETIWLVLRFGPCPLRALQRRQAAKCVVAESQCCRLDGGQANSGRHTELGAHETDKGTQHELGQVTYMTRPI